MRKFKIVVTNSQDLSVAQIERLESLGDVKFFNPLPKSKSDYLEIIKGADIICSGTAGLDVAYPELKNCYVTVSFVSVAFLDLDLMKKNNVTVSNAPGINKESVTEWIIWMLLEIARDFTRFFNSKEEFRKDGALPPINMGLLGKKLLVLGGGHIGCRIAEISEALGMRVNVFRRGDNLLSLSGDADFIINTLPENPDTKGLLNEEFFNSTKKGSSFISISRNQTLNLDALIKSVQSRHTYKAALDFADILVGDTANADYLRCLEVDNILCTPHIAYNAQSSIKNGNDVMIDNVEAFIKGKPQNILNP